MQSIDWTALEDLAISVGSKLLYAILVLIVGAIVIRLILKGMKKSRWFGKIDASVQSFLFSLIKIVFWAILIVAVIGILGIPMASIVAVLASAGVAIGLALQGALGNFAGGVMILIFRPFRVGDYIAAAGAEGTVTEISVFYTNLLTVDNKRITIPNGSLMSANVTNFSHEPRRRVDLDFYTAFGTNAEQVNEILLSCAKANKRVVDTPEAPFARQSGCKDNAMQFTLRAWCQTADYWDLHYELIAAVNKAFDEAGISAPATKLDLAAGSTSHA